MPKVGYYAVKRGRKPGIYMTWSECEDNVRGFPNASFKKFPLRREAEAFIQGSSSSTHTSEPSAYKKPPRISPNRTIVAVVQPRDQQQTIDATGHSNNRDNRIIVYCDGSALNNGRLGSRAGAGVYFGPNDARNTSQRVEAHEKQTNQRAELLAATIALAKAGSPEKTLEIRTDSKYVMSGVQSWTAGWKLKGWKTAAGTDVKHRDLWQELDRQCSSRRGGVIWVHVRAHRGEPGNEMADQLAKKGASLEHT